MSFMPKPVFLQNYTAQSQLDRDLFLLINLRKLHLSTMPVSSMYLCTDSSPLKLHAPLPLHLTLGHRLGLSSNSTSSKRLSLLQLSLISATVGVRVVERRREGLRTSVFTHCITFPSFLIWKSGKIKSTT